MMELVVLFVVGYFLIPLAFGWFKWKRCQSQNIPVIEEDLASLVVKLTLDDDFISDAKEAMQTIFEHIKQVGSQCNLKIGRTIIAGSNGKGTAILYSNVDGDERYPDLDLIVYINGSYPPFDDELELLQEILGELDGVSELHKTQNSLKFYFETKAHGKIKVDLLPAENHVVNTQSLCGENIGDVNARIATQELCRVQKKAIKEAGNVSHRENKRRSSSLAEITVKEINHAISDEYVLKVVMLAKHWNSKINLSDCGYVPARSCIIEENANSMLKTKSWQPKGRPKRLYYGFKLFLQAMSDFRKLDVKLGNDKLPKEIQQYSLPMIRDPANVFNNLAEKGRFPEKAALSWEEQARKTLELLNEEIKLKTFFETFRWNGNAIDDIFAHKSQWPHPMILLLILTFVGIIYYYYFQDDV